jgi:hypothetical protein
MVGQKWKGPQSDNRPQQVKPRDVLTSHHPSALEILPKKSLIHEPRVALRRYPGLGPTNPSTLKAVADPTETVPSAPEVSPVLPNVFLGANDVVRNRRRVELEHGRIADKPIPEGSHILSPGSLRRPGVGTPKLPTPKAGRIPSGSNSLFLLEPKSLLCS